VKVAHFLGKEGLLENTRGRGGGMRLAAAPDRINVGDVVRRTEGGDLPAECFDREHNRCVITNGCRLRGVLHEAVNAFYAVLARYTLADLVRNRAALAKALSRRRVLIPRGAAPAPRSRFSLGFRAMYPSRERSPRFRSRSGLHNMQA
jgi:Rrf2 family nitric oxide-sensitive transcriptional repressor